MGVVYTPNEIVQFMVQSTNCLLQHYFNKTLADRNVEILDPATGTGTFICEIIENAIPNHLLDYKFKNEIYANEVSILPYYIANLNIEYTFKQKMQYYAEFTNLCFVDTLDNINALAYAGKQHEMFGVTSENTERIKRQNSKKISVIIGNPPYNANQLNENENNKNREYPTIDKRIKNTYIKYSAAQKTKVYDMYARFYRWASDRLDKNGVLAFISNRSFIDSRTFDGFRKCIYDDFTACYIIDTKSDIRTNPKIAGTTHNVFGIQTGVAIMLLVKKENQKEKCDIKYISLEDDWRKEIKLDWLHNNKLESIIFEKIIPDKNNNWINLSENDFDILLPLVNKENIKEKIFGFYAIGVSTNRDEWVFDFGETGVINKIKYFIDSYNFKLRLKSIDFDDENAKDIKWSDALKNKFAKFIKLKFDKSLIRTFLYRPYFKLVYYSDKNLSDRLTCNHYEMFGIDLDLDNYVIGFSGIGSSKPFTVLASKSLCGVDFLEKTQCLPLYRHSSDGKRIINITDWGLEQFHIHYRDSKIKKEDIFNYIYAVFHNPLYIKKYETNLRRGFPRLPFYKDFWKWAKWGKELMEIHIQYESQMSYPLEEHNYTIKAEAKRQKELFINVAEPESMYSRQPKVKVKLIANKEKGIIEIDELTFLTGVPKEAWDYKLGNRSALEWVLDQYKEKKPKDPTIAEKFNTYRFADHKVEVIDLLKRVCTVSVETVRIIKEMEQFSV